MMKSKQNFETFRKKPFPKNLSTNEMVNDLFMDLVEYDSYIAGLIDQAVNRRKVDKNKLYYDQDLESRLISCVDGNKLDENSKETVVELLEYLRQIKSLLNNLDL